MRFDLLILAGIWMLWCGVHSLLATDRVRNRCCRRLGLSTSRYRLIYNGTAVLTLIPVLVYGFALPGAELVTWSGPWRLLQWSFWLAAGWLAWSGLQVYPLDEFLGLDGRSDLDFSKQPVLITEGVLGRVRHPWYLTVLLVLWARDLNAPALVSSVVLSGYLMAGALIEERRLESRFGCVYAEYRARVPMWIPWRGVVATIKSIFHRRVAR